MSNGSWVQFAASCLRQTHRASARGALVAALAAGAPAQVAMSQQAAPVVSSRIPEAEISVVFPAADLRVGDKKPFVVMVTPAQGRTPPLKVRARFGMPDHGHWVTAEESSDFVTNEMQFNGEFPMPGLYRMRIWLDYRDGGESKTAVDFHVEENKPLDPKVVP